MTSKEQLYEILEKSENKRSLLVQWFIIILICLNVIAAIIASFNNINENFSIFLNWFEFFSIFIFTIEYILRIIIAPKKYSKSKHPYLTYIFSFMGLIDLLAFLPFYLTSLSIIMNVDLRFLRLFRVFRILRLLKLSRYNTSIDIIIHVLKEEKGKLFMTCFILVILLLFASSGMYYIEHINQPDKFANILSTLWWAVATLTTIGYGDIYPITPIGKLLGGIISVLGIGLIALPSGIISAGLIQEVANKEKYKIVKKYHQLIEDLKNMTFKISEVLISEFKLNYSGEIWMGRDMKGWAPNEQFVSWYTNSNQVFYYCIDLIPISGIPYLQLFMGDVTSESFTPDKFGKYHGFQHIKDKNFIKTEGPEKYFSFTAAEWGKGYFCIIELSSITSYSDSKEQEMIMTGIKNIISVLLNKDFNDKDKLYPKNINLLKY
jgi:voltage-gated potassium channel